MQLSKGFSNKYELQQITITGTKVTGTTQFFFFIRSVWYHDYSRACSYTQIYMCYYHPQWCWE